MEKEIKHFANNLDHNKCIRYALVVRNTLSFDSFTLHRIAFYQSLPINRGVQLRVQQYVLMASGVGVASNDR